MLAEKQRENPWQEQPGITVEVPESRPRATVDWRIGLRHKLLVGAVAIIGLYFFSVGRSEALVLHSNKLANAQRTEQVLLSQNNELKIRVEQLKNPERVIGIAEKDLGMKVARNNIYVKAGR